MLRGFLQHESFELFMEGTFYSAPKQFNLIYIIYSFKGIKAFPLIYAFLPSRTTGIYVRMFNAIKNVLLNHNLEFVPSLFQIDFETSMISAIGIVFPGVRIRGCYFHFAQAIFRRIRSLGLYNLYKRDMNFNLYVQMVSVLPLVPVEKINDAMFLCSSIKPPNNNNIDVFENYINSTWLSILLTFNIDKWTQNDNFGPRTNNNLEGFHSKLNKLVKKSNPNFFHVF
jgi:hypothetical protein